MIQRPRVETYRNTVWVDHMGHEVSVALDRLALMAYVAAYVPGSEGVTITPGLNGGCTVEFVLENSRAMGLSEALHDAVMVSEGERVLEEEAEG